MLERGQPVGDARCDAELVPRVQIIDCVDHQRQRDIQAGIAGLRGQRRAVGLARRLGCAVGIGIVGVPVAPARGRDIDRDVQGLGIALAAVRRNCGLGLERSIV